MKALRLLVISLIVLIVGGLITANLAVGLPVVVQTADPNGSVFMTTPEQSNQFFFWVVFVLINVVGAGLTLALVFWLANRSVAAVQVEAPKAEGQAE